MSKGHISAYRKVGEYLLAGILSVVLVCSATFIATKAGEGASRTWDNIVLVMAQAEHSLRTPTW